MKLVVIILFGISSLAFGMDEIPKSKSEEKELITSGRGQIPKTPSREGSPLTQLRRSTRRGSIPAMQHTLNTFAQTGTTTEAELEEKMQHALALEPHLRPPLFKEIMDASQAEGSAARSRAASEQRDLCVQNAETHLYNFVQEKNWNITRGEQTSTIRLLLEAYAGALDAHSKMLLIQDSKKDPAHARFLALQHPALAELRVKIDPVVDLYDTYVPKDSREVITPASIKNQFRLEALYTAYSTAVEAYANRMFAMDGEIKFMANARYRAEKDSVIQAFKKAIEDLIKKTREDEAKSKSVPS